MTETTKGGNIILRSVSVPDSVDTGQPADVEVEVGNGALYIGGFDPDQCSNYSGAYRVEVVLVTPSGEELVKSDCIGLTAVGVNYQTFTFTVEGSDREGRETVHAYVRLPGSGKETDRMSASYVVDSDTAADADDGSTPSDGDGGGGDDGRADVPAWLQPGGGDGGGGGGGLLGGLFAGTDKLLTVLALLAIAWMVAEGTDLAGEVAT